MLRWITIGACILSIIPAADVRAQVSTGDTMRLRDAADRSASRLFLRGGYTAEISADDTGFELPEGFLVAAGTSFTLPGKAPLSAEAEIAYQDLGEAEICIPDGLGGEVCNDFSLGGVVAFLASVRAEAQLSRQLRSYLSAGLGPAFPTEGNTDTQIAATGRVGFEVAATPSITFEGGYRYLGIVTDDRVHTHTIEVGVSRSF